MPKSEEKTLIAPISKSEAKTLIAPVATPATTPASTCDDQHLLVPCLKPKPRIPWYKKYPPPYAIVIISIVELTVFFWATKAEQKLLRYNPNKQREAWRFLTYMFLHDDAFHIILNIVIQCLFAFPLEKTQGSLRVGALYFGGGAAGALGAGCLRPDLVVGASAGVYALLISHISHIILNYHSTKHKSCICVAVAIIVASDVIYNVFNASQKDGPIISEGAHVAGAVSGFLLGLILYRSHDKKSKAKAIARWTALALLSAFIASLLVVNFQIKRCTPPNLIKLQYTYLC